jgi:catechol 2,3-dioxygenase-like lactoylglutathione lyase family enzyme
MERPAHAGLRHLALNVRRLDEMKRFYVDVLGFAVEWEPDPDNVYLSSGIDNLALHRSSTADSSTLSAGGLAPRASTVHVTEASRASRESPLDHLGLIVREAGDVDLWAVFLEQRGVTLEAGPRTHRDGARSCYFRDPDGNRVQIIHHPPISRKTSM